MENPPATPVDEEKKYSDAILAQYSPSDAKIATLKSQHAELLKTVAVNPAAAKDPAVYKAVSAARMEAGTYRIQIEKVRKALKRKALIEGRAIDDVAKRLTALVEEIELPLKAAKDLVDNEREQALLAEKKAEADRIAAEEKAKRDAEEARIQAERKAAQDKIDAENARLAKEREELKAENDRIRAEQKAAQDKIDAANKLLEEQQRAAQAKIDEANRALREEQERLDRVKFEAEAKDRAEKRAAEELKRQTEAAEQMRLYREKEAARLAEEERAEQARVAAARPDVVKAHEFGRLLKLTKLPDFTTDDAKLFFAQVRTSLNELAARCEGYNVKPARKREAKVAS